MWEPSPPPTRSPHRSDELSAELGIWVKLLDCEVDGADFQSYGDVEDEFLARLPSEAALLLARYGHRWRDDRHKSTQYSMSVYLASRLRELATEGLLELRFLSAEGQWVHNGVISHWRQAGFDPQSRSRLVNRPSVRPPAYGSAMDSFAADDDITAAIARQLAWANRTRRTTTADGFHLTRLEDALFTGFLDHETYGELAAGAGGELNRLVSLRSSSCLAVNVFAPWRANPAPVARLLGGDPDAGLLSFERKFPTGLRGTSPHLDVVIGGDPLVAIESKYLESYTPAGNTFADSYFSRHTLWDDIPNLRRLAEDIATGRQSFVWLHAAQLVKHALGLRRQTDQFRLLLVWYRLNSPISNQIDTEIQRFSEQVAADIDFEAITYQQLAASLAALPEPMRGYLAYLGDRYGLE